MVQLRYFGRKNGDLAQRLVLQFRQYHTWKSEWSEWEDVPTVYEGA